MAAAASSDPRAMAAGVARSGVRRGPCRQLDVAVSLRAEKSSPSSTPVLLDVPPPRFVREILGIDLSDRQALADRGELLDKLDCSRHVFAGGAGTSQRRRQGAQSGAVCIESLDDRV